MAPSPILKTQLSADVRAPSQARTFVEESFATHLSADRLAELKLLVSELVANAVVHGAPPLNLHFSCDDEGLLRVSLRDQSEALPVLGELGLDQESGRGVALIDTLSEDWGVDPHHDGKTVWFRLRL